MAHSGLAAWWDAFQTMDQAGKPWLEGYLIVHILHERDSVVLYL